MDMTEERVSLYLWRLRTRWVAWIDTIKFAIELLVVAGIGFFYALAFCFDSQYSPFQKTNDKILLEWLFLQPYNVTNGDGHVLGINHVVPRAIVLFLLFGIAVLCVTIGLIALKIFSLLRLFNSSKNGRDPHTAIRHSAFWRDINLFQLGCEILSVFVKEPGYLLVFQVHMIIISGELLYMVHRFRWELETVVKAEEMKRERRYQPSAPVFTASQDVEPPEEASLCLSEYDEEEEDVDVEIK